MATTVRTEDDRQFTVELFKVQGEPLWNVSLIRGRGLGKESVEIGRVMNSNGQWYRENGFGWEARPTRKKCLLSLVNAATV